MATTLKYIYLGILFLLVVYALINFRKIKEAGGKYLVLVMVLSLVVDLLGTTARFHRVNFSWGYNIFIILCFPIYFIVLKESLRAG